MSDSFVLCLIFSILRLMAFIETTRQRRSLNFDEDVFPEMKMSDSFILRSIFRLTVFIETTRQRGSENVFPEMTMSDCFVMCLIFSLYDLWSS